MTYGTNIANALNNLQRQLTGVAKDKNNSHFGSDYATLDAVWETIREPLTSNSLAVVQLLTVAPPGYIGMKTIILHTSGESLESEFHMPCRRADNPQDAGSAITYARRYSLMAALGIAPKDDDDGNAASGPSPKAKAKDAKANAEEDAKQFAKISADWVAAEAGEKLDDMKALCLKLRGLKLTADSAGAQKDLLTHMTNVIKTLNKKGS